MERNLKSKIHKKFIEILLLKHKNWIFNKDKSFIIVKANASGVFRRLAIYNPTKHSTVDSNSSLYYTAEFIVDELFSSYEEEIARLTLSTLGVDYHKLDDYINIRKSNIYILPDINFPGDKYFEPLFWTDNNGNVKKIT